ncbi:MAG: hypothetical protein MUE40_22015 [Anaerolineae bacterium]|nr:hypothetical protein [Anaerolineae bacterium]
MPRSNTPTPDILPEETQTPRDALTTSATAHRFNLTIPDPVYQEVMAAAAESGETITDVLRQFLKMGILAYKIGKDPSKKLIIRDTTAKTDTEIMML